MLVIAQSLVACSTNSARHDSGYGPQPSSPAAAASPLPPGAMGPPAPFGPEPLPTFGPEPERVAALTLVLGPGGARALAHAGVLRALSDSKIPVRAVYGAEVGALVGTLYGMSGNANSFEFNLIKFQADQFEPKSGIFGGGSANGDSFEKTLKLVFGSRDLSTAKVTTGVLVGVRAGAAPTAHTRGSVVSTVRAALSDPGPFTPSDLDGQPGAAASAQDAARIATELAGVPAPDGGTRSPVIYVSVDGSTATGVDLVLKPDVRGIASQDYAKRSTAAFRGKREVAAKLNELRRLTGQKPETSKGGGQP